MSDDLIERIKVDREAGTPGPWHEGKDADEDAGFGWFIGGGGYCRANVVGPIIHTEANARRIARVPDMESRILADTDYIRELEAQVGRVTVSEAARVLLNNDHVIDGAFDASIPEIEKMAVDYAGNRFDAVGQLEIGEAFFRAALRAIQENDDE